ncbi:MAG: hypothetical protein ACKOKE_00650, partial [Actinomycetota bacterium]
RPPPPPPPPPPHLLASGALAAIMSGSGSSVVGLARDTAHAADLAAAIPGAEAVTSFGSA